MADLVQSFMKDDVENPPWDEARRDRLEFDGHTCQASAHGVISECRSWPTGVEVHHRLPRGRGGSNHRDNLVTLCPGHHAWVESHREEAYALGLLIRSSWPAPAVESCARTGRMGDPATRVLFAVMLLERTRAYVDITSVCEVTGRSRSVVHHHLVTLRDAGLVSWESKHHGTLRCSVRRVA